jgi:hypothetical protein
MNEHFVDRTSIGLTKKLLEHRSVIQLVSDFFVTRFTGIINWCNLLFYFSCSAVAKRGPRPLNFLGFQITHSDAPQSVGLL